MPHAPRLKPDHWIGASHEQHPRHPKAESYMKALRVEDAYLMEYETFEDRNARTAVKTAA